MVLGPKYYNINGILALNSYYFGSWTLRDLFSPRGTWTPLFSTSPWASAPGMDRTDGLKAPGVIRVFPKIGAGDYHVGGSYEDHNMLGCMSGSPFLRKLMLYFVLLFVVFPFSLVCTSLLGIFFGLYCPYTQATDPKPKTLHRRITGSDQVAFLL